MGQREQAEPLRTGRRGDTEQLPERGAQVRGLCEPEHPAPGLVRPGEAQEQRQVNEFLVEPRAERADLPVLAERVAEIRRDQPRGRAVQFVPAEHIERRTEFRVELPFVER